jgi:hypothetical protein
VKNSQPSKPQEVKAKAARILSNVPATHGFYFHSAVNEYTGQCATNLAQFSKLLETIDPKSVEFHLARRDFENWVRSLGDNTLSLQLANLRRRKGLSGANLRSEIHRLVAKRLLILEKEATTQ